MEAFRAKGYAKTTMQELVSATGLHPGSLYAAFGNKRGLLLAAVDHYVQEKSASRRHLLAAPEPLVALQHCLHQVIDDASSGHCLLTRTLLELAEDDELHQRLTLIYADLETDIATLLQQAQQQGMIAAERDIATLTAWVLINMQGLVTFAQCHPDQFLLRGVVTELIAALHG
jgi:AcrR family transcriptional regulator